MEDHVLAFIHYQFSLSPSYFLFPCFFHSILPYSFPSQHYRLLYTVSLFIVAFSNAHVPKNWNCAFLEFLELKALGNFWGIRTGLYRDNVDSSHPKKHSGPCVQSSPEVLRWPNQTRSSPFSELSFSWLGWSLIKEHLGTRQDILQQTVSRHHTNPHTLYRQWSIYGTSMFFLLAGGMKPEKLEETHWGVHTQRVTWASDQTLELWGTNSTFCRQAFHWQFQRS